MGTDTIATIKFHAAPLFLSKRGLLTLTLKGNHPRICSNVTTITVQEKDRMMTSSIMVIARVEKYLQRIIISNSIIEND